MWFFVPITRRKRVNHLITERLDFDHNAGFTIATVDLQDITPDTLKHFRITEIGQPNLLEPKPLRAFGGAVARWRGGAQYAALRSFFRVRPSSFFVTCNIMEFA